jgi:hypothetical protein
LRPKAWPLVQKVIQHTLFTCNVPIFIFLFATNNQFQHFHNVIHIRLVELVD